MSQLVNHSAAAVRALRLSCLFVLICACDEQVSATVAPPLESAAVAGAPAPSHGASQASSATTGAGNANQSGHKC